jgi:hypothetical protein
LQQKTEAEAFVDVFFDGTASSPMFGAFFGGSKGDLQHQLYENWIIAAIEANADVVEKLLVFLQIKRSGEKRFEFNSQRCDDEANVDGFKSTD